MCGRFILTAAPEAVAAQFGCRDVDVVPAALQHRAEPADRRRPLRARRRASSRSSAGASCRPGSKDPRRFGPLINARAEGLARQGRFPGRDPVPALPDPGDRLLPLGAIGTAARAAPGWSARATAGWSPSPGFGTPGSGPTAARSTARPSSPSAPAPTSPASPTACRPSSHRATMIAGSIRTGIRRAPHRRCFARCRTGSLEAVPVGTRVNRAENDDPGLIEPSLAAGD